MLHRRHRRKPQTTMQNYIATSNTSSLSSYSILTKSLKQALNSHEVKNFISYIYIYIILLKTVSRSSRRIYIYIYIYNSYGDGRSIVCMHLRKKEIKIINLLFLVEVTILYVCLRPKRPKTPPDMFPIFKPYTSRPAAILLYIIGERRKYLICFLVKRAKKSF